MFADIFADVLAYLHNGVFADAALTLFFCLGYFLFRVDYLRELFTGSPEKSCQKVIEIDGPTEEATEACCAHADDALIDGACASAARGETDGLLPVTMKLIEAGRIREVALYVQDALQESEDIVQEIGAVLPKVLKAVSDDAVAFADVWAALEDYQGLLGENEASLYGISLRVHAEHDQLRARIPALLQRVACPTWCIAEALRRSLDLGDGELALLFTVELSKVDNEEATSSLDSLLPSFTTLLSTTPSSRILDVLEQIFKKSSYPPNAEAALREVVDQAVADADFEILQRVEQWIETKRVPLSAVLLEGLILGYAQVNRLRAIQLYDDFVESSSHQHPATPATYKVLIETSARTGDMERTARLFAQMCAAGVEPDLTICHTLVKGYCVSGDLAQAIRLFGDMRRRGIRPDTAVFNCILDACERQQMRALAEQVFEGIEADGVVASNVTLSIMMKIYGRSGDLDRAFHVFETVPAKHGFSANTHVYTCLINACLSNDSLERGKQVFAEMQKKGCAPDAKTYRILVNGCLRQDDVRGAAETLAAALDDASFQSSARTAEDAKLAASVLFMIGRRQLGSELGTPLLAKLKQMNVDVSEEAIRQLSVKPLCSSNFLRRRSACEDMRPGIPCF